MLLRKESLLDGYLCCKFCLVSSMELILILDCSILYLQSNDMNSLKNQFTQTICGFLYHFMYRYNLFFSFQEETFHTAHTIRMQIQ